MTQLGYLSVEDSRFSPVMLLIDDKLDGKCCLPLHVLFLFKYNNILRVASVSWIGILQWNSI